jgi:hypothetical protein
MPTRQNRLRINGRSQTLNQATDSSLFDQTVSEYATPHAMPLGDSSASAVLQNVRAIVQTSIGKCDFTTSNIDPVRNPPVSTSDTRLSSVKAYTAPSIDPDEAPRLLDWFLYSTNGMLDLFDHQRVHAELEAWAIDTRKKPDLQSAVFYLVLAIGAQTCPDGLDLVADRYYRYGWHLGLEHATTDVEYASVQYFSLVGTYLMGQSLMNAAFIQIGSAVRAALVLGLHQKHATTESTDEAQIRTRLWATVRSQDLFFSATLGRPITTKRFQDPALVRGPSATADTCHILEAVLMKIYAERSLCDKTVQAILDRHRVCVGTFDDGLENDGLGSSEYDEHQRPHIGVCHAKHITYANIQLLTMPFLIEKVRHRPDTAKSPGLSTNPNDTLENSLSPETMAFACVDAGISLVGLFHKFLVTDQIPRRLPMAVYAMFYVALSFGLATFGNLDTIFPLQENIRIASELLMKFGKHDWLAKRYAIIVGQMQVACNIYIHNRCKSVTSAHRNRVQTLLGSLDLGKDTVRQDHASVISNETNTLGASSIVPTIQPHPVLTEPEIAEREVCIDSLALGSSSSQCVSQHSSRDIEEHPNTYAGDLLPFAAGGDVPYEAQLWESVWLAGNTYDDEWNSGQYLPLDESNFMTGLGPTSQLYEQEINQDNMVDIWQ